MRGPLRLLIALPLLAAPAFAKSQCPPLGSPGISADWGRDFRERARAVFEAAKAAAGPEGLDPNIRAVFTGDLPPAMGRGIEEMGSPLMAIASHGFGNLPADTVIYAPSALDVACDEAQLATLMLHEIEHLKRDAQGRNHDARRTACRLHLSEDVSFDDESEGPDGSSLRYSPVPVGKETANEATQRVLEAEIERKCYLPLEQEADAFAIEAARRLPYPIQSDRAHPDANRDARVQAFKNLEKWIRASGEEDIDPSHGTARERAEKAKREAVIDAMLRRQQERDDKMSRMSAGFKDGSSSDAGH